MAKKPTPKDWHPAQLKAALHMRGITLRGLSLANGLHMETARHALKRPYPKMEWLIADALGVHPSTIWPSRYKFNPERVPRNVNLRNKF